MKALRKDFPDWIVKSVYIQQDAVCLKCGNSLKKGFHRHHKDGNPANNSPDNLELLCSDCHYTTFKGSEYSAHKGLEKDVLQILHAGIHRVLEKKLSGAALERMILAGSKVLSISRFEKGLLDPVEVLPEMHVQDAELKLYDYARGYEEGIKRGIELAKSKEATE